MARKSISSSKALDLIIKYGHKLTDDELALALDSMRKVVQAEGKAYRATQLKNPHPKDIADARSRRARGMDYDKELLGDA